MTTDEQTNPNPTGTWEPDYYALTELAWGKYHAYADDPSIYRADIMTIVYAVIKAYRRQQAAQEIVEVDRDVLEWALMIVRINSLPFNAENLAMMERLHAALVAATEQKL